MREREREEREGGGGMREREREREEREGRRERGGSYVCRVYAAEPPSTATASTSAAAGKPRANKYNLPTECSFFNINDNVAYPAANSSF